LKLELGKTIFISVIRNFILRGKLCIKENLNAVGSKCPSSKPFRNKYRQHLCIGFEVLKSVESQPTFQNNMPPFLLDLFFHLEDGGDIFLRNVGCLSIDYTVLYPRSYNSSVSTCV
jgi:hypothetical protein